ncbi:GNAT family N-acetyltransferase [Streptomyces sp. NPDC021749]|uniref:GNAT family N-acetyltransferase n=1 Tax=Streptomyces sp. NPDC021749 TaxID=3154905 RepID=UPI0033D773F5
MDTFLETARMALRPLTAGDLDRLVELNADPEVMRYLNGGRPTPRETVRTQSLPRLLRVFPATGTVGYWAAETKGSQEFLGWFEFRPVEEDSPAVVELGYRLRRAAWGRGYATEGARALIRRGFTELGVHRVTARTMAVNAASRRVMEKAGLHHVRSYFADRPEVIAGSEHGEVEYALTRAEWEQQTAGQWSATRSR